MNKKDAPGGPEAVPALAPHHLAVISRAAEVLESYGKHGELVRDLRAFLDVEKSPAPPRPLRHPAVPAELTSDDMNINSEVDAVPWLLTLSDDMLARVCLDHGASDETDQLFWWLLGSPAHSGHGPAIARGLCNYLDVLNAIGDDGALAGFTVHLDPVALRAWTCINRPQAFALYEAKKEP